MHVRYIALVMMTIIIHHCFAGNELDELVTNEKTFLAGVWVGDMKNNLQQYSQSKNENQLPNTLGYLQKLDLEKAEECVTFAKSVRPIVSNKVIPFCQRFLEHKKQYGSDIEKTVYQHMTVPELVVRFYTKRPYVFYDGKDIHKLRDGQTSRGGFENIGTTEEAAPLLLKDYLSYDEMQLSAKFGISSDSFFIDNGSRASKFKIKEPHVERGVITGSVGARFEKKTTKLTKGVMEATQVLIQEDQNTPENGYGEDACKEGSLSKLWADFYGIPYFPRYGEIYEQFGDKSSPRFQYLTSGELTCYFDADVYQKRLEVVIEPLLIDAQKQGKSKKKDVYVHMVGLGLGAWLAIPITGEFRPDSYELQLDSFKKAFAAVIDKNNLSYVKVIDFSWFPKEGKEIVDDADSTKLQEVARLKGIKLIVSKRNRFDVLPEEYKDMLLYTDYAWDGNAFAGNEYWIGMLGTDDPDAAKSSLIGSLQNPEINQFMVPNILKSIYDIMVQEGMNTTADYEGIMHKYAANDIMATQMIAYWKAITQRKDLPQKRLKGKERIVYPKQKKLTKEEEEQLTAQLNSQAAAQLASDLQNSQIVPESNSGRPMRRARGDGSLIFTETKKTDKKSNEEALETGSRQGGLPETEKAKTAWTPLQKFGAFVGVTSVMGIIAFILYKNPSFAKYFLRTA